MRIRTGAYWWRGCDGGVNQDSLTLQHVTWQGKDVLLAAVCDGIGSLPASEQAGAIVVRQLTKWFHGEFMDLLRSKSKPGKELFLLALQRQIYHIQELLLKFQQDRHLQTGTTLSCLLISRGTYFVAHIGDGRIYQIRKKWIKPVEACRMTTEDRDERGRLLACLGMECQDPAFYDMGAVKKNQGFLLCTDGFYRDITDQTFAQVLPPKGLRSDEMIKRRLELLAKQAVKNGSRDNMSGICISLV